MTTINISTDFSPYPGLRYRDSSKNSGEAFRDDILIPALKENSCVVVDLDGTMGYGSSFLEEAFGGTVRKGHTLTLECLDLRSTDNSLIKEIWEYINEEMERKKSNQ